jgi:stage II sporulation protein M
MTVSRRERPSGLMGFIFGKQVSYVRGLAPLFVLCLFGFGFSMFAGYYLGESISFDLFESIMEGFPDVADFDFLQILFTLVYHNVTASLLWMVLGVLGGLPSLFFAVFNGFVAGYISYVAALSIGVGGVVATLLPHGVFELPAVLLSSAAGLGLGYALINRLRGRGSLRAEFVKALRLFITKVFPLFVIAGTIESILIAIALGSM